MEVYVGTSGWMYDWNPDGFDWYVKYSGLNAVELNASFYRFPYSSQIKGWARRSKGKGIRWAVKVSRLVTHVHVMNEKAIAIMRKFLELFKPLDEFIDFYLLQLPPRIVPSDTTVKRIEKFVREINLGWRLAIEWRNARWFTEEWVSWGRDNEVTVVSVDSPEFTFYARSGPYTYLRMHGRSAWYCHYYTDEELRSVAEEVIRLGGSASYIFFNNDHDMLENARRFLALMNLLIKE